MDWENLMGALHDLQRVKKIGIADPKRLHKLYRNPCTSI
jgi:hypothetical protein